ncbi:DUF3127 domain-containing protein [Chryseobacterium sp. 18068]|uniref:DUF3127 domain-containing protein n=1 Tax=Chryseobacterium sp. 18068 TaxID=2681414 RepID=UPI00135B4C41|nr:DUF3127 domain-containing protein [Chryseobacterium sp. 18068]
MANQEIQIKGTVISKSEKANVGQSYESQSIVVVTEGEYPQYYPIEMQKNTFTYLDTIEEGDSVELSANVKGKKWQNSEGNDKYFVNITGFRISKK